MACPTRIAAILALLGLPAAGPALALDETIQVPSRTMSDEDFLRGTADAGTALVLSGTLSGPDRPERLPAVILLHGTDGPRSGAVWAWSDYLNGIGVATLSLDSYTARGLESASADQTAFGQFVQIHDAYRAVDALAAHPRVDPDRIAVMGFSRGGSAALYSALLRFQDDWGPKVGRIRAHLPFYPACNFVLVAETVVAEAPIREFHGAKDDWTPPAPCRDYIGRLAAGGRDATMMEFPGAQHAFDNPRSPSLFSDDSFQTSRNCVRKELGGRLINAETGQPFRYSDACVEYGPHVQYNDAAATAAQGAVRTFLRDLFALR